VDVVFQSILKLNADVVFQSILKLSVDAVQILSIVNKWLCVELIDASSIDSSIVVLCMRGITVLVEKTLLHIRPSV
jgi:hypothetical protein